jgi:hypothetical protein
MIPFARRFSLATAVCLAAAAVPVWLHAATGPTFDPCRDPGALARLPAYAAKFDPTEKRQSDGRPYALAIQGELPTIEGGTGPLRFFVLRGAEPHHFLGRPESTFLSMPLPGDRTETHALAVGTDVLPVHRRYDDSLDVLRFSEYTLIQGTTPVRSALTGGLANALDQLVRGTEPVTMFLIQGFVRVGDDDAVEAVSDAWLTRAWSDYREACLP